MPRKKIREFDSKRILKQNLPSVAEGLDFIAPSVQVTETLTLKKQLVDNPWLKENKLVIKPDMLFGQRGKHGLIKLDASYDEAVQFLEKKVGEKLDTGKLHGELTHFLVEPFCPHEEEYYLSILVGREEYTVNFSAKGGIHVEENWDKSMKTFAVPNFADLDAFPFEEKIKEGVAAKKVEIVAKCIRAAMKLFDKLDFSFMEWNPWTVLDDLKPVVLDMRGEIDDCAVFTTGGLWKHPNGQELELPPPFGKDLEEEEAFVEKMDAKTGASLKLTIMNRTGRIWTLVAGGGASVIYADTVADNGYGDELGNYGEYSGGPNEEETYKYAKTVIKLLLDSATLEKEKTGKPPRPRALLIGGGIANFTDVAKTFKGIVHALKEVKEELMAANAAVFVRRAGPNYQLGLSIMRKLAQDLGIPIDVYAYEVPMTHIIPMALKWLESDKK